MPSNPSASRLGRLKYTAIMSPARSRCEGSGSPVVLIRTRISSNSCFKAALACGNRIWAAAAHFVLSGTFHSALPPKAGRIFAGICQRK